MNHMWQVHRDTVSHPDGQRRWDRAFQLLLQWANEAAARVPLTNQEDNHAHCTVCPRLDPAAAPDAHD